MTRHLKIKKAAVIGAGTMGSGIAAHLANCGIPSLLMDIVPPELSEEDKVKGLTADSSEFRNRIAQNAIKAMPDGGTLSLNSRLHRGNVEVEVRDTGAGIPEEIRDRIFNRMH